MVLLANIYHHPVVFWVLIPTLLCFVWIIILAWESRLPPEKKFLDKIRKGGSDNSSAEHEHSIQH